VRGFQARKLRDDDPLRAKYVNTPEGELFRKGELLYGLHLARNPIAKEDRAVVVEGNPDVIALRAAGVLPVVASMGTALTERQLKELSRLTRRLYLCFDGDAAGQDATLRGMELALAQGFEVRVVALPPGVDPADEPAGFERRLAQAASFPVHRVRIELERAADKQEAFVGVREILRRFADSPEVQDAVRLAADRLDLPPDTLAGLVPRGSLRTGTVTRKVLERNERLERMFLAACVLDPVAARPYLEQLRDEHFDKPEHQRLRAVLVGEAVGEDEPALRAELWATAEREGVEPAGAKGLFLALEERFIERQIHDLHRREMTRADEERHAELVRLQSKIRDAVAQIS
jgi:DNA primase